MSEPWPTAPAMPTKPSIDPALKAALLSWDNAKKVLTEAKEAEMLWRKTVFELGFSEAREGTNTLELPEDYKLKGVKKLNYKLVKPESFSGSIIDAVDECVRAFSRISNEGGFVADRIFKYSVDMSVTEYKKLIEESEWNAPKRAMLAEINKLVEITEAAPTLTIVAPKAGK